MVRPPRPQRPSRPHRPSRLDVALCYGTRPQVIKAAQLIPALRERWRVLTVDTGQHYDFDLNGGLYQDLGVPTPDVFLDVGPAHPVEQTARMAAACAQVLLAQRPRMVVVVGDTNSTLACALAAAQVGIPVTHVEAGLRSGQQEMAEERNRIAVDGLSRILCAPSAAAADNLHRESMTGQVVITGDVSRDVLEHALPLAPSRDQLGELPPHPYAFVTLHRAELVDHPALLAGVVRALGQLPVPVVFSVHPRTRRALEAAGIEAASLPNVQWHTPFRYLTGLAAIRDAAVVITDSGGVQREAYWMGTPCLTMRTTTEWHETVACGANTLVAPQDAEASLTQQVTRVMRDATTWSRDAYGNGTTAARIADALSAARPEIGRRERVTVP